MPSDTFYKIARLVVTDPRPILEARAERDLRDYDPLKPDALVIEPGLTRQDHDAELNRRIQIAMARDPDLTYRGALYAELEYDDWLKRKVAGFE